MSKNRTPYHFRPMDELLAEGRRVEMALRDTGQVVEGWLVVVTGRRRFQSLDCDGAVCTAHDVEPIGWREIPTPEIVAAWKDESQAASA